MNSSVAQVANLYRKPAPDLVDRDIFRMLTAGSTRREIAARIGIAVGSVETRVCRIRANRWATASGKRLLTPDERQRLLDSEKRLFG